MRILFFAFAFALFPISLFGQHQITGKVIDNKTNAPLAFVNIIAPNVNLGTTTDIDGKFSFSSTKPITTLKLSYVGYELTEIDVYQKQKITIKLNKTSYDIAEFKVLPGINPAERIIKEVVKNRKKHNPEKSLNFKYDSYSKMYFTVDMDTSILNNPEKIEESDSSLQETLDWLDQHYIFMMESVSKRKYKLPDKNYEKIVASRVSGLKNPTFTLIGTQMQSFSFYNSNLNILDKSYLNPISTNSINKYLFLIEDTTFNGADTVYIISFRPRKGKNFDAMKGLLYVNTNGFALQNVLAEPFKQDEDIGIKIQQQYEKIDGSWFPIQLNSTLIFSNAQMNGIKMMGIGKTYLKNIEINPELSNKEFSYIDTEIDIDATKKDEEFWNKYRSDTLSQKEQNTYHVIDSIGKAENFDKKIGGLEALFTGKLRWGKFDLDLNRFFGFNNYEGFRLGAGIHTNQRLLKWVSFGGYGAYAFKDKEEKYGGDVNFFINKRNDVELNFSYQKDVEEPGVASFYDYKVSMFSPAGVRVFYLNRMNNIEKYEARLKFRTVRYLKVYLFGNQERVDVTNDYYFSKTIDNTTVLNDKNYLFNEVGIEFRYAFKEKIIKTLSQKYNKPTKYPILYTKIQQGMQELDGEYKYTKITARVEKKFLIKNLGRTHFFVESGYVYGKVPQHKLTNSIGTYKFNTLKLNGGSLGIATQNAFETMLPYEFFSSQYVHFHFEHDFRHLLLRIGKFEPEFVITTGVGFGNLDNSELHNGVDFKTMEKGFYESGLKINNLFRFNQSTFGVGGFYRYGPYQLEKKSDNFTVKVSLGYYF
jgi:Family of unknown function (DUF5686)/CarboxypepD_reg-like domain